MSRIPHSKPFVGAEEKRAAAAVIASGQLSQGPQVAALEKELTKAVKGKYGAAVSSGTTALALALRTLGVGKGESVVIPSYVCTALLNAVNFVGAKPSLADVDPYTGNMTVASAKKAIKKNTGAIIVPHLFGNPAPVQEIESLGITVIEDCAQCVGAKVGRRPVGSLSTVSVFSFYSTKVLAAGEGGMVVSKDKALVEKVRELREYDNRDEYAPGFNFKMSDIHAAIAREQVKKLPKIVELRRRIAGWYGDYLGEHSVLVELPEASKGCELMYYRYVVRTKQSAESIVHRLRSAGIDAARPVYKPLHRYLGKKGFPGTDRMYDHALSLPAFPHLRKSEAQRVASVIHSIVG